MGNDCINQIVCKVFLSKKEEMTLDTANANSILYNVFGEMNRARGQRYRDKRISAHGGCLGDIRR
jgi:hypothetical protein